MKSVDNGGYRRGDVGGVLLRDGWSRSQKTCYQRLRSWISLKNYEGKQLLRVDLTSSPKSDGRLVDNFKHLLKKIKREFGYDVEFFKIVTTEGHGVIHSILAIKSDGAVWIGQKWLSDAWGEINNAKIASIKRMGSGKRDMCNVSKYLVSQYLAGQSAIKSWSYSWGKLDYSLGKVWKGLKALVRLGYDDRRMCGESPFMVDVGYKDLLRVWDDILRKKYSKLGDVFLYVLGGSFSYCVGEI